MLYIYIATDKIVISVIVSYIVHTLSSTYGS